MKKGIIILLIVSIIIMLLPVINEYISGHGEMSEIDVVEVNQLISEIESSDDMVVTKSSGKYTFDYTILDLDQNVIYTSVDEKSENYAWTIVEATKNRDTIRDLNKGEKLRGWLIIYNNTIFIERIIRTRYERSYYISFIFCLILWIIYGVYIYIKVIRPFDKMKDFASAVAMGELDKPLEMDRGNIFGAFTESFDIMREELEISRKREYEANVSKRELVANLSHDIKTPVASIKAMSELLEIKSESSGDDFVNKKAKSIGGKADQIDTLVSNLFASTLKELEKLEVNASELESGVISKAVADADYNSKVRTCDIKECIIYVDKLRINQVISNIIYNSYKYAGTDIVMASEVDNDFLYVSFSDKGGGVSEEELPLIMDKFRRGSNSEGIEGSGLGLSIAKGLMQEMQGTIECANVDGGFRVILGFKLCR